MTRFDRHHILFPRKIWSVYPQAATLRGNRTLIPIMEQGEHAQLHREVPPVPMLGFYAIQRTLSTFEPVPGDTLKSIDNLLLAIEDSNKHPRTHQLERDLAAIVINTIELQIPFFK